MFPLILSDTSFESNGSTNFRKELCFPVHISQGEYLFTFSEYRSTAEEYVMFYYIFATSDGGNTHETINTLVLIFLLSRS